MVPKSFERCGEKVDEVSLAEPPTFDCRVPERITFSKRKTVCCFSYLSCSVCTTNRQHALGLDSVGTTTTTWCFLLGLY